MEKINKKIVVKLGRSVTINSDLNINTKLFVDLARQIKELQEKQIGVILVVSGAVISGRKILGAENEKFHMGLLASLGQLALSSKINEIFSAQNLACGQMLIEKSDFSNKTEIEQIKEVVAQAIANNIVLVFNENDAIEVGTFFGNDFLAAELAKTINADCLLLLTDVEGVLDKNMRVLTTINEFELEEIAELKRRNNKGQIGGMIDKIKAAFVAKKAGIKSIIANGETENILTRIFLKEEKLGTEVL